MKFHVLTLFPEMIEQGLGTSVIGKAMQRGAISLNVVNIRDYTEEKHGKVDDYPYGGGAGMLMQAQPVYDACRAVTGEKKIRTVYVTPQGKPFTQKMAEEFSREEELLLLCGHYEGIDERVLEEVVTDRVSIGDYVLTGGELPAMVMIDAIARLVPGVLGNENSAEEESFYNDLLEYPQYSRPEVWHEKRVPEVLLSGNHKKISAWRLENARERTREVRPELYAKYEAKQQLIRKLSKEKRNHIAMIECLRRGAGEILWEEKGGVLLRHRPSGVCMVLGGQEKVLPEPLLQRLAEETGEMVVCQEWVKEILCQGQYREMMQCIQYLYPQKETLSVTFKDIRQLSLETLSEEQFEEICRYYTLGGREYLQERIQAGAMYGAFEDEMLAGFIGIHSEGSLGMLYVPEKYRGRGIARSLEAYAINKMLERDWIPYVHVIEGNEISCRLQEKLGLYRAEKKIWWLEKAGACQTGCEGD